jgi:hypothetical protein
LQFFAKAKSMVGVEVFPCSANLILFFQNIGWPFLLTAAFGMAVPGICENQKAIEFSGAKKFCEIGRETGLCHGICGVQAGECCGFGSTI